MKTIHKLFLIATIALGLGFVACNDADDISPVDESKANTHVSVTLKLSSNPGTRALPEDYNYLGEWAGKDEINNITVYLVDGSSVTSKPFSVGAGQDYEIVNDLLVPTKEVTAIKTTAGTKKVYVLINAVTEVTAHLNKTPVAEFEDAYQKVALELANVGNVTTSTTSASKLAVKNGVTNERIVMTNVEPKTLTVEPNITAAQTLGAAAGSGSNPNALNRVSLEVERAVARVMVTISKNTYNVPDPNTNGATSLGTISNITYVAAQGENSLFVQRKSGWETPNYDWVSTNANYNTEAGDKYDYSGLFEGYQAAPNYGGTVVPTMAQYTPVIGEITSDLDAQLSGKFILPTTHKVAPGDNSDFKKGNTAYVLVRAQFTPADASYADGGTYTAGEDFFVGGNGKFYTSAANALTPAQGGVLGQTVAKYVGGKVLYYAWVNPDDVPSWYNSPVLRNNIYHIHITGFKNLGTNWNPLFPEDPTTSEPLIPNPGYDPNEPVSPGNTPLIPNPEYDPKNPDPKPQIPTVTVPNPEDPTGPEIPVNPEEPVNPIDPEDPLTTPETWMSVDVKVLPWKVHSYDVELGM